MTPAASPGSQRSPEGAASPWEHVSAESGGEEAAGGGPWSARARDEGLLSGRPRMPLASLTALRAGCVPAEEVTGAHFMFFVWSRAVLA